MSSILAQYQKNANDGNSSSIHDGFTRSDVLSGKKTIQQALLGY
jgi:hypothetical protein